MSDGPIFHLAMPDDWVQAFEQGSYEMSTRGRTLDEEGFIHCSTRAQLEATATRFYGDVDELVILTIAPGRVPHDIRWEPPAPDVDELFPHVYGPLPMIAVLTTTWWTRQPSGWHLPTGI